MTRDIIHRPEKRLFTVTEDGFDAYVEYTVHNGAFDVIHTFVPKEIGGRGIAGELVEAAYSYAEAMGLSLKASCSYAAAWLLRNLK